MAWRSFPAEIPPTGRTYKPGRIPETVFEAQNGAVSIVQYGQNFVNAELTLDFANITDDNATKILQHYASVLGDDAVVFGNDHGFQGIDDYLQGSMENGVGLLRWRYKTAPQVQSIYPGISSVQLQFIGVLYGA